MAPAALGVVGMAEGAVVQVGPEDLLRQAAEIGHDTHQHILRPLQMQGQRQVMVIDHIVPPFRAQHGRDHVPAKVGAGRLGGAGAPFLAFQRHLANSDGDLGRAQLVDLHGTENGLANRHVRLLECKRYGHRGDERAPGDMRMEKRIAGLRVNELIWYDGEGERHKGGRRSRSATIWPKERCGNLKRS